MPKEEKPNDQLPDNNLPKLSETRKEKAQCEIIEEKTDKPTQSQK